MSMREIYPSDVPFPDVEIPEFKAPTPLNRWKRFRRNFDERFRSSMPQALMINFLLLGCIILITWACVATGGFLNPSTMLGLFSLPILLSILDILRLLEQNEENEVVTE